MSDETLFVGASHCEIGITENGLVALKFEFSDRDRELLSQAASQHMGIGVMLARKEAVEIAEAIQQKALSLNN